MFQIIHVNVMQDREEINQLLITASIQKCSIQSVDLYKQIYFQPGSTESFKGTCRINSGTLHFKDGQQWPKFVLSVQHHVPSHVFLTQACLQQRHRKSEMALHTVLSSAIWFQNLSHSAYLLILFVIILNCSKQKLHVSKDTYSYPNI